MFRPTKRQGRFRFSFLLRNAADVNMALYFIPIYQMPNENLTILSQDALMPLNALSSLSEQMKHLTKMLEIPSDEFSERRVICRELIHLLRKFYPKALLLMFGSSINSFGLKGCNLDLLFLPFPSYCNLDYTAETGKVPIPDPASILTGEVSKSSLSKFDELNHLKFIRTVLRKEKIGKKVKVTPLHSFPHLKVQLDNSKIVCDIFVGNELVVLNSELLQFFEKTDVRVKPLVVCLRFWARSLGFIKKSFFSSYAFTLLIIFFLQSINPPILPPVKDLILLSGFCRRIAGWQTAFPTDMNVLPRTKNTETVGELLLHFFNYYFHFDFLQYVVSPHHGKIIAIKDLKMYTDKRMVNFEITSLNIQDIFVLSHNVCKIKNLTVFKLALLTAYNMLKDNEKLQFNFLFDPKEYQRVLDVHYFKFVFGRPKEHFINLDLKFMLDNRPKVCFIKLRNDYITKFENLQSWYDKICNTVYEVLQYGLLIECEVTDKISSRNNKGKSAQNSVNNDIGKGEAFNKTQLLKNSLANVSVPYDLQLLLSIQCVLYSKTWIGRENVLVIKQEVQDELEVFVDSALSDEYYISKSLVHNNPLLNSPAPVLCFTCDCYKHVSPEISDIIVMLKPYKISREFSELSSFLVSFISRTVNKILTTN